MTTRASFDSRFHWSMSTVGSMLGWSTKRTREFFVRNGWATKLGGRWVVTTETLRAHFPSVAVELAAKLRESVDGL